jgi:RNA polymerase sigma-70 factor (ECF subfamily)
MDDKRARFDARVMPHLDAAHRFARWLTRSPSDADDVVQEAILRAYRSFDGLRGSDAKAWLLTIVKNCHRTMATQARGRVFVPLPLETDAREGHAMVATTAGPEAASMRCDEARTLVQLMAALPEEHREILLLREIEELDYREIAAVAQIPIGTVMSRLARARAALRERWLAELEAESDVMP